MQNINRIQEISSKIKEEINLDSFSKDKLPEGLSDTAIEKLKENIINNTVAASFDMLGEIKALKNMGISIDKAKPDDLRLIGDRALRQTFMELYLNRDYNLIGPADSNTRYMYKSVYRLINEVERNYPEAVINDEIKILAVASLRKASYVNENSMEKSVDYYGEDRC